MRFSVSRRKLVNLLILVTALLTLLHGGVLIAYYLINDPNQFDFVRLVDFDYEGNIPSIFSVFLFAINSILFFLHYRLDLVRESHNAKYWLIMALVFLFLAVDEGARIHEEVGDLMEYLVDAKGLLFFPWVIPYSIALAAGGVFYFGFIRSLSRQMQTGILWSMLLFLTGALGIEIISAMEADTNGTKSILYSCLYTIEEILEMSGLIVLINTLFKNIEAQSTTISIEMK